MTNINITRSDFDFAYMGEVESDEIALAKIRPDPRSDEIGYWVDLLTSGDRKAHNLKGHKKAFVRKIFWCLISRLGAYQEAGFLDNEGIDDAIAYLADAFGIYCQGTKGSISRVKAKAKAKS